MENEYKILNQITPEIKNPYRIVDGYFDGIAEDVLLKIASKKVTYQLPEEYFETLSYQILNKVKVDKNQIAEELEEIAPFLNSLKNENPYKIPVGYFNDLSINQALPETKIISIKNPSIKWMKYISAAVFAGILVTGGLQLYNKKDAVKVDIQASIQSLPEAELLKGIDAEKTSLVSANDYVISPQQDLSNLQNEIQSVSDEEIEIYLKENTISSEDANSPNS
jgi:hypothetical protein